MQDIAMPIIARTVRHAAAASAIVAMLAGCAQSPVGPTVLVMPGPGKPFDAFANDQAACKFYATSQIKGQAEASNQRALGTAALGTLLGAGLGAAIGGAAGNAGAGAAIGAGTGALGGTSVAGASGQNDQAMIQVQYNNAYAQCMYSKGDQVPGFAPPAAEAPPTYQPSSAADPGLVGEVQRELIRLNYLQGPPDGTLGPRTRSAITGFEQNTGLPVDGTVSSQLLARLQATGPGTATPASAMPSS